MGLMSRGIINFVSQVNEIESICGICGKHMKRITHKHLETHGVTVAEYKEQHGELTFSARVRAQIIRLFDPNRHRWAQQMDDGSYRELQHGKTYTKGDGESYTINYWLNDGMINSHLTGKQTISIFPRRRDSASFLIFDVDTRGRSDEYTLKIVEALYECGINREDIHVSHSGSKGYHVELFWTEPVPTRKLERFGAHIKSMIGVTGQEIEIRPRTSGGTGIKLPLGYHRKTSKFCGYVDNETLEPVGNPYHYFLAIQPIDPAVLEFVDYNSQPTVSLVINNDQLLPPREEAAESAKSLYLNGLIEPGTRHYAVLKIALWLRDEQGIDRETAESLLIEWTRKQYRDGMLNGSLREAEADLRAVIKDVFVKGKYRLGATTKQITLSTDDIQAVYQVKQPSARLLYFALILHGKMFADGFGQFTAGRRQLMRFTRLSEHTIKNARDYLVEHDFIRIVEMGAQSAGKRRATKFQVPHLIASPNRVTAANIIEIVIDDDIDCRQLLAEVSDVLGLAA